MVSGNSEIREGAVRASFRDPSGSVFVQHGRIFRILGKAGEPDFQAYLASDTVRRFTASGALIGSTPLDAAETGEVLAHSPAAAELWHALEARTLIEHDAVAFPSFPYEWPPEMLHAAGCLTIDLCRQLLNEGLGLKDGTPYNVLFRGPEPVFVDVLSIERRNPRDPMWLPYAQFVRTFLLPLALNRALGMGLDLIFTSRRDGIEPEDAYRWISWPRRLRPPFLTLASVPTWLGSKRKQDDTEIYRQTLLDSAEKAAFVVGSTFKGAATALRRLEPKGGRDSVWSDYMVSNNNYLPQQFEAKQRFVERALNEFRPGRILDAGCNTGHFSAIGARSGASVVAIDYDPVVVGSVWHQARREKLDILPLVVNLTRPSPGIGWENQEQQPFLSRARGRFDAVFMLAVIHHMLVTERAPLASILSLAAELTRDIAIVEFVGPEDSMFRRLTRGRDHLHRDLNTAVFEKEAQKYFAIVRSEQLPEGSRWLYLLRKR